MSKDTRNLVIFGALALILLTLYQTFVLAPIAKKHQAEHQAQQQAVAAAQAQGVAVTADGQPAPVFVARPQALATSARVAIDTPTLAGSINLKGGRLDDLFLKQYRETTDKRSPPVELLRPEGAQFAYFAETGWQGANLPGLPGPQTVWTLTSTGPLTATHPVVLTYASPQGLTFTRTLAVDAQYMFTVTDVVANHGAAAVTVLPYGSVQRRGVPPGLGKNGIVHEGAIGILGGGLQEFKYADWKKKDAKHFDSSTHSWLGITDKYWMTILVPDPSDVINAQFRITPVGGVDAYESEYVGQPRIIPVGRQITTTSHLFAGAKRVPMLNAYEKQLNIPRFDDAVDWGFLSIITKPVFTVVEFYHRYVGNFGIAILLLTVTIRLIMFPVANNAYEMSTKMKKLQPQMKELQAKYKEDPATMQRETMALYQREKVNVVTGCFPILLQIPVFYSLTKVFTVTIEMRQAPFFGWIHDLSAPDPTTIWNLFGLIPWDVFHTPAVIWLMALPMVGGILTAVLHLSAWPILYAFTLWLSQSMTPMTGVDPMQQKMMQFMPLLFMFILAQSSVGLVIYWAWSSVFTIGQQYVIMRRFKVENPIDDFFARFRPAKEAG